MQKKIDFGNKENIIICFGESKMKNLTGGNAFKKLLLFAIPLVISGILSQTYNLIDLIVAGKYIGSDSLSAIGCTSTFIQFLSSLFWGMGVASATVCGELYGEGKYEKIVRMVKTVILTVTGLMVFLTLFCVLFSDPILRLLKTDPLIFEDARRYFRIYMVALLFQSVTYQITSIQQSLGNSRFPMVVTTVSSLINLLLNLLFVIALKSGTQGLAWASVISGFIGLLMAIWKTVSNIKELGGKNGFDFSAVDLRKLLKIALPCILQQCSLYLSSVIVQPLVNGMGKDVSAGYSVAMNINLLLNAVYHSISRAVASYASQSKGAGLYKNFGKGIVIGIVQQMMLTVPFAVVLFLFPDAICGLFVREGETTCLPYATEFVRLCLPFLFFVAFGNLLHSFYKSVEAVKSVLFSTVYFTIARIGFTYLLPQGERLFSVYLGLSLAWVSEAIVLTVIYFAGGWKSEEQRIAERQ